VTERIAEVIRYSRQPEGEMFDLSAQAQRLSRSIAAAEKWMDATMDATTPPEMTARAEMIHDQIEEELARVVFELEDLRRRREHEGLEQGGVSEGVVSGALLSDTLIEAYCLLAQAPKEMFGVGELEASERTRYRLMGAALLAAQDAANAGL
jgi:hypothetical protein